MQSKLINGKIEQISSMTFGDIYTTLPTSGMEPFVILLDGFQSLVLLDTSCVIS